jgi:hypothetical protein
LGIPAGLEGTGHGVIRLVHVAVRAHLLRPEEARSGGRPSGLLRITVDGYELMTRAGAFNDPDRVELIDGCLVQKISKSAEHGYGTKKLIRALDALLPAGWTWRSNQPVRIPD